MLLYVALGAAALALLTPLNGRKHTSYKSYKSHQASPPPTSTKTDQLAIFRSAFWRSPAAGDEILNAERREWSDADGLDRWQWFIALRPSPELVKYVRDDNAFGLSATGTPAPIDGAPAWFAFNPASVEVLRSSRANLQCIFSNSDDMLSATSSGNGFTRGAAPRSQPVPPPPPLHSGRLPLTPPPNLANPSGRAADRPR